jgi:hypothetical protein
MKKYNSLLPPEKNMDAKSVVVYQIKECLELRGFTDVDFAVLEVEPKKWRTVVTGVNTRKIKLNELITKLNAINALAMEDWWAEGWVDRNGKPAVVFSVVLNH